MQQNLPGTKHISHAHLGRDLEDLLKRTHAVYRAKNLADIEKNPVEWTYTAKSQYDALKSNVSHDLVAVTNTKRYIKKVKSNIDFSGVAKGKFAGFDAKQTKEKSLPLKHIQPHQLENLLKKEKCGGIAGFMILFSSLNRLFFVSASVVDAAVIEMLYKKGRKSLSFSDCEQRGKEIEIKGNLADWLAVLT